MRIAASQDRILTMAGVLILSIFVHQSASADTISLVADPWCPYNCQDDTPDKGFMVEIATEALALAGHDVAYKNTNWARAKLMVQKGSRIALVGMSKTSRSEPLYVFPETPLGHSEICIFHDAAVDWQYNGTDSLQAQIVSVVNDYGFGENPFHDWVKDPANKKQITISSGKDALEKSIRMLQYKRITLIPEDRAVMRYTLKNLENAPMLKSGGCINERDPVYVVFSKANAQSHDYAKALDEGVARLLDSGRVAAILQKYGMTLEEW